PGLNDGDEEIGRECDWVLEHLGPDVPLHFTAFHPDYRMLDRPRTPAATLGRARAIARARGIRYCYVGNVHDAEGQTTFCASCGAVLIERDWHAIRLYRLDGNRCVECGAVSPGGSIPDATTGTSGSRPAPGSPSPSEGCSRRVPRGTRCVVR